MDNAQEKINALLSDPENIKTLAGLASAFMAQTPDNSAATNEITPETPAETATATTDALITTALTTETADQTQNTAKTSSDKTPISTTASASSALALPDIGALGSIFGKDFKMPGDVDKSIGLLNALKPYLGSHKRQTCETMVRLLGMVKILGTFNTV